MTLLDEYRALPSVPGWHDYQATAMRNFGSADGVAGMAARLDMMADQIARRDAVIRLLVKALQRHIDPNIDGHCGSSDCDICDQQAELRALLSAVEREFGPLPEGRE